MTLPASDSFALYGGIINDYSAVEDPSTDLAAVSSNQFRASTAAMTATAFRVVFNFYIDISNDISNIARITNIRAVWDTTATNNPTITYMSVGIYRVVFPSTVYDLLGNIQTINLLGGFGNIDIANTTNNFITVNRINSTTFDIYSIQNGALTNVVNGNINIFIR
jgi:head-tail adaptor